MANKLPPYKPQEPARRMEGEIAIGDLFSYLQFSVGQNITEEI